MDALNKKKTVYRSNTKTKSPFTLNQTQQMLYLVLTVQLLQERAFNFPSWSIQILLIFEIPVNGSDDFTASWDVL